MITKTVTSGQRSATATISEETKFIFSDMWNYFHVQNMGTGNVYISMTEGKAGGDDGVITVLPGCTACSSHSFPANSIYITADNATDIVQVVGSNSAFLPFKSAQKGGDKNLGNTLPNNTGMIHQYSSSNLAGVENGIWLDQIGSANFALANASIVDSAVRISGITSYGVLNETEPAENTRYVIAKVVSMGSSSGLIYSILSTSCSNVSGGILEIGAIDNTNKLTIVGLDDLYNYSSTCSSHEYYVVALTRSETYVTIYINGVYLAQISTTNNRANKWVLNNRVYNTNAVTSGYNATVDYIYIGIANTIHTATEIHENSIWLLKKFGLTNFLNNPASLNFIFDTNGQKIINIQGNGSVTLNNNGVETIVSLPLNDYSVSLTDTSLKITGGVPTSCKIINSDLVEFSGTDNGTIQKLELYNNNLSNINLSGFKALQKLVIHNNPISSDTSKLIALCNSLPNRAGKLWGSIVIDNKTAMMAVEPLYLAKDWMFGSAYIYDSEKLAKIDNKIILAGIPDYWESAEYGNGMTVCVADSSLYQGLYNIDYENQFLGGWNVADNNALYYPSANEISSVSDHYHGSAVTNVICGNGTLAYGVCPKAQFYFARICADGTSIANTETAYIAAMEKAINWNATHTIDVFNLSYSSDQTTDIYSTVISNCKNANVQCIISAGNENSSTIYYPKASENALAISAATNKTTIADYSSHFIGVDYAAYTNITTECKPNQTSTFGGTSCATSFLTGCYMLIKKILTKKNGVVPTVNQVIAELNRHTLWMSNYNSDYQGKGLIALDNLNINN